MKDLEMGRLFRWAQYNQKGPSKEKGGRKVREGDVMMGAEVGVM